MVNEKTEDVTGWTDDILQREKYADFLTKYLVDKEKSFVININAPWGSGKTFFIERWHEDIKKKHPSILFNAWKNDFSNDPLLSVISCIDDQLASSLPNSKKNKDLVKNLVSSSCRLLKSISPVLAKAAVTKIIGSDGVSKLEEEINRNDENLTAEIVGKVTGELVKNNKEAENAIVYFQEALEALVDVFTVDNSKSEGKDSLKKPLFIFIDELDRCRPLYAIELLERIKHLFGVPGIVFVIATDTEQLKHSINAIYGSGFDSGVYLRRFFDQSYTLPTPNYIEYAKLLFCDFRPNNKFSSYEISVSGDAREQCVDYHGNAQYEDNNEYTLITEKTAQAELILLFALFSEFFKLDLRTQNQCYEKILAIISSFPEHGKIQFPFLAFLVMLEAKSAVKFKKYFAFPENNVNGRLDLINDSFSSSYNVRAMGKLYTALEFVNLYSRYAFGEPKNISNAINNENDNIRQQWLNNMAINNCGTIKQYKERVELACQLG